MDMRSARSVTVLVGGSIQLVPGSHLQTSFVTPVPRSRPRLRTGQRIEVVLDTERRHLFDPKTGLAIRT
jgi:hypothetical protein